MKIDNGTGVATKDIGNQIIESEEETNSKLNESNSDSESDSARWDKIITF